MASKFFEKKVILMSTNPPLPNKPKRRRFINKKNRSAWILSFILIILMVVRLAAGFRRAPVVEHATNVPTAVATP
ncbi:MAG: hypothetical protein H6654_13480 [Ardenticatenaceae bacterium]|nr:hypothetical protein [Anaerolineales bacterium]MCB8941541.1 hypothetical protein [Ardenticatenaceae bacterium]MCB8974565.1 hypothetical protein [Ardenticatenaceae bacterium]